jgi:hypothetical protein
MMHTQGPRGGYLAGAGELSTGAGHRQEYRRVCKVAAFSGWVPIKIGSSVDTAWLLCIRFTRCGALQRSVVIGYFYHLHSENRSFLLVNIIAYGYK